MLKKSKVVIEVTLSEIYQAKREEKKKVDLSKGYYNPQ